MKFSIIIPVYNVAPYLRECLDSLLAQTYADWEAVCVDDGSTDNCGVICDEYARQDPRVVVIHQNNGGEGEARNSGLRVASGEWIFFLDGDDIMSNIALEILSKMIEIYPSEKLIRFSFENFKNDSELVAKKSSEYIMKRIDISKSIKYEDYYVYVWQFLFQRDIIDGLFFKRYKRGADRTFIIPVLCNRATSFVATDAVCYYYRQRQGSAVNSVPSIQVLCDEMDHRLDVAEIMDNCGKDVSYSGTYWIEQYFTKAFPCIMLGRPKDFEELRKNWKQRLLRAHSLKGFSKSAKRFFFLHTNWLFKILADFYTFQIPLFRRKSIICKLFRKLTHRGEYSKY